MLAAYLLAADSVSPWFAVAGVALGAFATLSTAVFTTRATSKAHAHERRDQREFEREQRESDRDHDRALRQLDLEHQLERARSERRDEWHRELRDKMLEVAAELSGVLGSALLTAEFLRTDEVRRTATAIEEDLRSAPALIGRVRVLFGPASEPADAAVVAHIHVEHLFTVIKELASLEGVIASDETEFARNHAGEKYGHAEQRFSATREEAREYVRKFNEATSATLWELGNPSASDLT